MKIAFQTEIERLRIQFESKSLSISSMRNEQSIQHQTNEIHILNKEVRGRTDQCGLNNQE